MSKENAINKIIQLRNKINSDLKMDYYSSYDGDSVVEWLDDIQKELEED